MADDTFRQERKNITASDIGEEPTTVEPGGEKASLESVLEIQKQAGIKVPEGETQPSVAQPRPMEGIQVKGNMPPAMQQALQRRLSEIEGADDEKPVSRTEAPVQVPPHQNNSPMQPGQMTTNDPNLNALIGMVHTQNYETVMLPSKGRFYHDVDTPTTGEVNLRPMTGQEESILSTNRFMRHGRGIEMIFRNCLLENHFNPERFLSIDRTFLLVYLRGISYGNLYEVTLTCSSCGHQFDYDIDLNLPVDFCPDAFTETSLVKTTPTTQFKFKYRLMTGQDESEVSAYRERKTRFSNSTDDTFLYRASLLITEIGKGSIVVESRNGIHSLLEKLPVSDVNYIRNQLNNPPFGANTQIIVPCPACGTEFPVELPYEANFFFPRERTESERR